MTRYRRGMVPRCRSPLCLFLFAAFAVALPAQGKAKPDKGKPEKPKAEKADKADKGKAAPGKAAAAPKDDPVTAKDPAVVAIDAWRKAKVSTAREDWRTALPAPPLQTFDPAREYRWHLQTSKGLLVVKLLPEAAPMHVTSVIYLARCGFYDGLVFPRILRGFMAQGGSPNNTQGGNAGYSLDGEFRGYLKHDVAGTLSAANSGQPHTDGSQFFLTFVPTPHLDGKHTVHGRVVTGLDVLTAIEACGSDQDGEAPRETVTIQRSWITVVEKPAAPGAPAAPAAPGKPAGK